MDRRYVLQDNPEQLQKRLDKKWQSSLKSALFLFVSSLIFFGLVYGFSNGNIFEGSWKWPTYLCIAEFLLSALFFVDFLQKYSNTPNVDSLVGTGKQIKQENDANEYSAKVALKELQIKEKELELREKELKLRERSLNTIDKTIK